MNLYVKIGSMPAQYVSVVRKRKPPSVGERFFVRESKEKYACWSPVRLLEVREVGGQLLYVLERF